MSHRLRLSATAAALVCAALTPLASAGTAAKIKCGRVVTASITLKHDLDCVHAHTDGLVVGAAGITIDLAGHTITIDYAGSGGPSHAGIRDNGFPGLVVRNGTIRSAWPGVSISAGAASARVANVTVTDSAGGVNVTDSATPTISGVVLARDAGGISLSGTTNGVVEAVTATDVNAAFSVASTATTIATDNIFRDDTATIGAGVRCGAAFLSVGPASAGPGRGLYPSPVRTSWIRDTTTGCAIGFDDTGSKDGVYANDTASNGGTGWWILHTEPGLVTLSGNVASGNADDGFHVLGVDGGTAALSGNRASDNGGDGFYDLNSDHSTWTGNESDGNGGDGFDFDDDTAGITSNVAHDNTGAGFRLALFGASPTSNTAYGNDAYGFYSVDRVETGSGNVAHDNTPADCYQVTCSSS
jgi:hypothetical protein